MANKRVCFEEQMMRQLLKLVKQGELSECEHLLLVKEMEVSFILLLRFD